MDTRLLYARLKRLEFRLRPGFVRPEIEICLVDSKAQVLCKIRLGPDENQYFSVDDQQITKEETARLSAAAAEVMKAIDKRLDGLADQFGSPGETAHDLWLRQRLESAKRRIAEAHKHGDLPLAEEGRPPSEFDLRRLEILKQVAWRAKLRADRRPKCEATQPPGP